MATVAFLVNGDPSAAMLGPVVADRLARLGVTSVTVLRDGDAACVVLDGWAFDPDVSSAAAARAIGADASSRTFHAVMQSAVRPWNEET